jgi:hypothetical protein
MTTTAGRSITILRTWCLARDPVAYGAALLAFFYAWAYLRYPELPGTRPNFPNGWWDWFDQSKTLRSAVAFAHGDLNPADHWYPLGYSMLGAAFARPVPTHAFFFVDLAALLLAFVAFCRFAAHAGLGRRWSVALFVAASLASRQIFDQWAIPWNTSPTAALTWLLLALVTSPRRGAGIALVTGAVAGCIPLFRPTDAVLVAAGLAATVFADLVRRRMSRRFDEWGLIAAGAAVPVLAYGVLYVAIYGFHETDYMRQSRALGFTFYDFGWKAYVILIDPRPWFGEGDGLLRRCPWIALSIAGVIPALRRGRAPATLVAMLAAHAVLYLSYVDLLPTGFWRFDNVHYWIWALPGYAVLAFILLQDLCSRPGAARWVGGASVVATGLVLCLRVEPVPVAPGEPAKMLGFPRLTARFDDVYSAPFALRDAAGEIVNVYRMRVFPVPGSLRAVALRRPFVGAVSWVPDHAPTGAEGIAPTGWKIGLGFGWPCWLPRSSC